MTVNWSRYALVLLFVSLLLFSGGVLADCGSKGTEWVRNKWGKADFSSACRTHDRCYDTCGRSKSSCDSTFFGDMKDSCRHAYSKWNEKATLGLCFGIAESYYRAVDRMGGDAYRRGQREHGCR